MDAREKLVVDVDALERRYAEERDKRLRIVEASPGDDPELSDYTGFEHDFYADPDLVREAVREEVDVLVIGGGMGGLITAAKLRERGVTSLRILEKGGDF